MNKLQIFNNQIVVTNQRGDTETLDKLKLFYPVHSNRISTEHHISLSMLPEVLCAFRGLDEHNIDTAPLAVQNAFHKQIMKRQVLDQLMKYGPTGSCVVNEHLTLDKHQQLGREISEAYDRFAFFYAVRTGKTPMALTIINDDLKKHPNHKWLILCPLILIDNAWLEDAAKFFPEMKVVKCHASTKDKRLAQIQQQGNVYVLNTEAFVKWYDVLKQYHTFEGCFVDESSDIKSPKSNVSKTMVKVAPTIRRFYLLSGTPAPNGEWEYYTQMRCIDYYLMPPSYTQFKAFFFDNVSYNPQYEKLIIKQDKKPILMDMIRKYALFIDQEDVLDLPGREFIEYQFDMPTDLKKHYNNMKSELYVELGDMKVITKTAASKLNKLNQISSGFVIDTEAKQDNADFGTNKQEVYMLSTYRFEELFKLLSNPKCAGQQVLIWANYHKEFEVIKQMMEEKGLTCRCVYGLTPIAEKNENIKLFKEGKIQYLICNPASADKGLTLTNAHICIYFSLNWSYELYIQSMNRIYGARRSQPKFCTYYIMEANKSVDVPLYQEVLQGKAKASYAILNHLKPEKGGLT